MDLLDSAEKILENDREVIVAVPRLWEQAHDPAAAHRLPLGDFTESLARDDRFEVFPARDGIPDYVKLRRVKITPGVLAGVMSTKIENAITTLVQAWDERPPGDRQTEEQLIQILAQARKLREDLQELMGGEQQDNKPHE